MEGNFVRTSKDTLDKLERLCYIISMTSMLPCHHAHILTPSVRSFVPLRSRSDLCDAVSRMDSMSDARSDLCDAVSRMVFGSDVQGTDPSPFIT